MIKQYEVGSWLTRKQNLSTARGELAEALILNSIFRLNAGNPIGDVEESQLVENVTKVKEELEKGKNNDIDSIVKRLIHG